MRPEIRLRRVIKKAALPPIMRGDKMSRRLTVFSLAIVVSLGIFFSGCGQKVEKATKATKAAKATKATKVAKGKVILTYGVWAQPAVIPLYEEIIRRFEKKYPGIKVRAQYGSGGPYIEKLKIELVGGSAPDLWMMDGQYVYNFAERGVLKNLTKWFHRDMKRKDYYCMDAVTDEQGRIWAVPYSFQSYALYYNKDLFDAAGLAYPTKEWTWEDMVRAAKKLTRPEVGGKRIGQFGLGGTAFLISAVLARGIRSVEEEGGKLVARYNTPALQEALREYVELRNKDKVIPSQEVLNTLGTSARLFAQGRLGMWLGLYYAVSVIKKDNPGLRYDVALPPRAMVGKMRTGYYVPNIFGITASASWERQQAAWKFIKFFSSYKIQKLFGRKGQGFPFLKRAAQALVKEHRGNPAHLKVFLESIKSTVPYIPSYSEGRTSAYAESQGKAESYLEQAIVGNVSVQAACRQAQRAAQTILDNAK
mgnify:CR=1 FL=1